MKSNFIEKLELYQKANYLSISKLSRETGIRAQSISDWKRGKTEPKLSHLIKLAEYFDITVNDLVY